MFSVHAQVWICWMIISEIESLVMTSRQPQVAFRQKLQIVIFKETNSNIGHPDCARELTIYPSGDRLSTHVEIGGFAFYCYNHSGKYRL